MTWKQLHTQNQKSIKSYMAYLEDETTVLDYDNRLKLITEIGRLNAQNSQIDNMLVEDYHKEVYTWLLHKTAS